MAYSTYEKQYRMLQVELNTRLKSCIKFCYAQLLLNQERKSLVRAWFLEIAFVREVSVCVCVCPPPRP